MSDVLLIDDNELNRDLISRYLGLYGHSVSTAVDGHAGQRAADELAQKVDVILMDLNLPGIDGWELSRLLKSQDTTRSIPIIAITAHAMVGDREKALNAGCDDYVTKPINFEELLRKIESVAAKACTT